MKCTAQERISFEDGIRYQKVLELMSESLETCENYLKRSPFPSKDVMACLDNAETSYNVAKELLIKYENEEELNRGALMGDFHHLKFLKQKVADLLRGPFPREGIEGKVGG